MYTKNMEMFKTNLHEVWDKSPYCSPSEAIQRGLQCSYFSIYIFFLQIFLRESDYIIKSRKNFFWKIKEKQVPNGYQSILFDAKSLFTKILLDGTIDIILSRIYVKHKLKTSITSSEMKELLILRTENVHFTFDIAMGSLQ